MNTGTLGFPQTLPVAAMLFRSFRSGGYYSNGVIAAGTGNLSFGGIFVSPFPVGQKTAFDRIGIECTTGVATAIARLGIYSTIRGYPGPLVMEAGAVDASTNGQKDITIVTVLDPGLYWLAASMEVATAQWRRVSASVGGGLYVSEQAADGTTMSTGYSKSGGVTAGSLPTDFRIFTTPAVTALAPRMFLRAA